MGCLYFRTMVKYDCESERDCSSGAQLQLNKQERTDEDGSRCE